MAFNSTQLFTVLGKYIKAINAMDGFISTYGAIDTDLETIMNSQGYLEYYSDVPDMATSIQNGVTTWINNLITNSKNIFLDRENVLEELAISSFDFDTVLKSIHEYMYYSDKTFKESLITLGGDTGTGTTTILPSGTGPFTTTAKIIVSDKMSATQAPRSGFLANPLYNNVSSQLAASGTISLRCTSSGSIGSETIQLYGSNQKTNPYNKFTENPGPGPSLVNAHNNSVIATNWDFTSWTNDDPTGWSISGGVSGTDWEKSATQPEYLLINSNGVSLSQLVPAMTPGVMYMVGVYWKPVAATGSCVLGVHLDYDSSELIAVNSHTKAYDTTDFYSYDFLSIPQDAPDTLTLTISTTLSAAEQIKLYKVVVVPVVYYNGLAWVAWSGNTFNTGADPASTDTFNLNDTGSIAIVNGDEGVFQTFFNKAYKTQLPTATSGAETVSESLAT